MQAYLYQKETLAYRDTITAEKKKSHILSNPKRAFYMNNYISCIYMFREKILYCMYGLNINNRSFTIRPSHPTQGGSVPWLVS